MQGSYIVPEVSVESCASPVAVNWVEAKILAALGTLVTFPDERITPPGIPTFELTLLKVPEPLAAHVSV